MKCPGAVLASLHHIVYNTIYSVINGATEMNTISANDLKTKGVSAIEQALADQQEASVTVRGQMKYVVMSREQYAHLRECELEAALAESKADLDAGRFVKESVEQHMKRLAKLAA
jgi:PHD/YefM family antitoxin component YafN of YafNO toxin-antitoxin module